VVSLNPDEPIDPKPLIADMLRTRYCIPGSIFLVESVESRIPVSRKYRAVRVLLGDGELCVQALLHPEIHCFVDGGQIYEGCYVRVDKVELRQIEVTGEVEDVEDDELGDTETAMSKTRGQPRKVLCLLVGDMITVGWNNAYLEILGVGPQAAVGHGLVDSVPESKHDKGLASGGSVGQIGGPELRPAVLTGTQVHSVHPALDVHAASEDGQEDVNYMSSSDDAFETMEVSEENVAQRRTQFSGETRHRPQIRPQDDGDASGAGASTKPQQPDETQSSKPPPPWMANDPTQPLRLTPLRSVPNLPYKQNWMVNVLAVVASLSDVEPSHLPPYTQRTARLVDPSTPKQVLLTVFLEPGNFAPAVGSVVLLLGVKNHRFDGGSLKKYVSDKPKNGASWWIEDPGRLGWCEAEAVGLKAWW
ncbi:hypothetical protein B0T26DRAFT_601091, partial [Lasiosphaeria miniovina]